MSDSKVTWTSEAEARLENIPVFVRPMAKMAIEKHAIEKNIFVIDESIMAEVQQKTMGSARS